jgi:hypothetical protein
MDFCYLLPSNLVGHLLPDPRVSKLERSLLGYLEVSRSLRGLGEPLTVKQGLAKLRPACQQTYSPQLAIRAKLLVQEIVSGRRDLHATYKEGT